MADWIPADEPGFDALQAQYSGYLNTNQAALKVSDEAKAALETKTATYKAKQAARDEYERQGAPVYQALRDAREALTAEWRTLNGEITSQRTFTDVMRAGLGLPPVDSAAAPAGAPTSKPVIVKVDSTQRLIHIVHWVDENTPGSKAKPPGVKRAILFRKIGAAPAGVAELEEVAADTATPYMAQFADADAGKPCHWAIAWENSAGERGPLSAVMSWTIPG